MRLPGTRYQEHGWEQVRKLLGHCSLAAFADCSPERLLDTSGAEDALDDYIDFMARALRAAGQSARAEAAANSYGESVAELALALVCELQARPADWLAMCAAIAAEYAKNGAFWKGAGGEAMLRKKANDMYAVLRDKVDSDNYQVACGRPCSPNRMYAYRMLDTAYGEIARLFEAWQANAAQVGAILGRGVDAMPIEVRQMKTIGACQPEWIMRWSETLEQFGGAPGPLHTRSKRFASLKTSPGKIADMLREIGDYEELSSNRDQAWLFDSADASDWLDDLWRVCGDADDAPPDEPAPEPAPPSEPLAMPIFDSALAASLSLPPRYLEMAWAAQDAGSWSARMLAGQSLPVRLAVYAKMLGTVDDSYPAEWLDPATGELPTMQQLAGLDQLSLPTLRKRRDAAMVMLLAAANQGG